MIPFVNKYRVLLVLGVLFNTIPRFIHGMYIWQHRSLYYVGQALSFWFIHFASRYYNVSFKWDRVFWDITIGVIYSNTIDELFFDPIKFGLNEVIVLGLIIIGIGIRFNIKKPWGYN